MALLILVSGILSDAVRNYVLSHTTQVFQTSYQTHLVRENLAEMAFEEKARCDNGLVGQLRNRTLNKDKDTPIDPTADNLAASEKRRDMTKLHKEVKAAQQTNKTKKVRSLNAKADHCIEVFSKFKVKDTRKKYFAGFKNKRALGLSTKDAYGRTERKKNSNPVITALTQILQETAEDQLQSNKHSQCSITFLIN